MKSTQRELLHAHLREHLSPLIYRNDHEAIMLAVERMMLRAYATGQTSVTVGGCGADAEIHRLDFGSFPWDFDWAGVTP